MFKFIREILSPEQLKEQVPLPENVLKIKRERDRELMDIFTGRSGKLLLVIGPCSADNEDAVCEYVTRLAAVQEKVRDKIFIVPRIYTNKPRTSGIGYKGMLHQPDPGNEPDIYAGIIAIRRLQVRAVGLSGMTAADEMLYPENFSYFDDILSYHAVGARSVENQLHRLVSSGAEVPIGMKNPTSGDLTVMFNSIIAAQSPHNFLYRGHETATTGNPLSHAVLRGSVNKQGQHIQNYHYEDLVKTLEMYRASGLANPAVIVDINHSNSSKQHLEQPRIAREILHSRNYNSDLKSIIKGLMIESYLEEGNQDVSGTVFGRSITDACLGFADSERLIYELAEKA
ncbi:MAG: 3-deoxy-7-phosphoheptulonate synthase [Oscillospiraceae bacterium]|nr:3-deoxy-7-phosphoheptulonate synthase [Oscillospiraceae bacterium]